MLHSIRLDEVFFGNHLGFRAFSYFRDAFGFLENPFQFPAVFPFRDVLERHGTLDAERCSLSVAVNLSDVRSVCRESARSDDRSVCRSLFHGSRDVRDSSLSTRAHGTIQI